MLRLRRAFAAAAAALLALTAVPAGATEPAPQPETTPEATPPTPGPETPGKPAPDQRPTGLRADGGEFYQLRVDITRGKWNESSVPELISAVAFVDLLPEGKRAGWACTNYEHNLSGSPVAPFKMR